MARNTSTKKMRGKSTATEIQAPTYKPSIYLNGKQVPGTLAEVKAGGKVTLQITGKLRRRVEGDKGLESVDIKMDRVTDASASARKPRKG